MQRGAYTADRAAALSGVPKSTVHDWARKAVLIPSVSDVKVKLWSYSDLLGLRTIAWLRATKKAPDGYEVPASTMRSVRAALAELDRLDLGLWGEQERPHIAVDRSGRVLVGEESSRLHHPEGQELIDADVFDVLRPLNLSQQLRGPDLVRPRPRLRIVPGKLSGSPHVRDTRIETEVLAGLRRQGVDRILALYPVLEAGDVNDALSLEADLMPHLAVAA